MRTPVEVAGEAEAEAVAWVAEAAVMPCVELVAEVMPCVELVAEVGTMAVVAVFAITAEALVADIPEPLIAIIREALVADIAAANTTVITTATTNTVTVIIVTATVMAIGAAVFGLPPASSGMATPAAIARGSTITTTAVGYMNANNNAMSA